MLPGCRAFSGAGAQCGLKVVEGVMRHVCRIHACDRSGTAGGQRAVAPVYPGSGAFSRAPRQSIGAARCANSHCGTRAQLRKIAPAGGSKAQRAAQLARTGENGSIISPYEVWCCDASGSRGAASRVGRRNSRGLPPYRSGTKSMGVIPFLPFSLVDQHSYYRCGKSGGG
jgi:hypothetical protein